MTFPVVVATPAGSAFLREVLFGSKQNNMSAWWVDMVFLVWIRLGAWRSGTVLPPQLLPDLEWMHR